MIPRISGLCRVVATNGAYSPVAQDYFLQFILRRNASKNGGFLNRLVESVTEEMKKNKELKENLQKLEEAAKQLEDSDALKDARSKYKRVESETSESTKRIWQAYAEVEKTIKSTVDELSKSDVGKRGSEVSESMLKSAREALDNLEKMSAGISQSSAGKGLGQGISAMKKELDDLTVSRVRVYQRPDKLQKRSDRSLSSHARTVAANDDATTVELHKEARWYQSWKEFSDNNQYINKMYDWKMKFDESENPFVRTTRFFTHKLSGAFEGIFTKNELSDVLTEICKMDPSFSKEDFLLECEREIIPNVLEAMIRGDLEILKDWCYEAAFNQIAEPIRRTQQLGYFYDSRIIDINTVDLVMGKIMEQGPVLIITFTTSQLECVKDKTGKVVEGDETAPLKVHHVWVLCRDPEQLDPKLAWKLLELHLSAQKQFL